MAGKKTTLSDALASIPHLTLAAIGFGSYMVALEASRMPVMRTVTPQDPAEMWLQLFTFVLLIGAAMFSIRRANRRTPSLTIAVIGVLFSISMIISQNTLILQSNSLNSVVPANYLLFEASSAFLFFFWMKTVYPLGPRSSALVLATGTIVCGAISAFIALLKTSAAEGIVILLPMISVICLCYFRDFSDNGKGVSVSCPQGFRCQFNRSVTADAADSIKLKTSGKSVRVTYLCMLAGSLVCYAVIFGQIHFTWIATQDGEYQALAIQAGIATGTLIAGLLILVFVRFFWGRNGVTLYCLVMMPLVLAALWLSAVIEGGWVFSYLVLLNVAQKLTNLFIVLAPFILNSRFSSLSLFWMAYLAFECGKVISTFSSVFINTAVGNMISAGSVGILLICGFGMAVIDLTAKPTIDGYAGAECNGNEIAKRNVTDMDIMGRPSPTSMPDGADRSLTDFDDHEAAERRKGNQLYIRACQAIAKRYQLTNREEQVLELLGRGRTAQHIASNMVISPTTAKTHLRNMYAKMDIHTQQEVISQIEHEIEELKKNLHDPSSDE